jgi:CRISPR-associated protein Cas1
MEPIYIKSNLVIFRQGNTIYTMNKEMGKKPFPIKNVSDIYCLGRVTVRSGAADLLMKEGIPVHFYNKYGGYVGSLMPKEDLISGKVVIAQAACHLNKRKRLEVAREIVLGIKASMLNSLKYYQRRGKDVGESIIAVQSVPIDGQTTAELMGQEGMMWKEYYDAHNLLCVSFPMQSRAYRPPTDPMNSLISLANSMLYTTVLSEIQKTYLHPAISFLHEPLERRYSLALDLADLFKPLICTRVITRLVNQKIIREESFDTDVGYRLKEDALAAFIQAYHKRLTETKKHPTLKRNVSHRYMIRLECYKLAKHFLGDKKYRPIGV